MTESLHKAIQQLQQMPEERQDVIAKFVLHEIEQDELWSKSTEDHADKLKSLVEDVLAADERGECETLSPDEL